MMQLGLMGVLKRVQRDLIYRPTPKIVTDCTSKGQDSKCDKI